MNSKRYHDIGLGKAAVDHAGFVAWMETCARTWANLGHPEQANRVLDRLTKLRNPKNCSVCCYQDKNHTP